MTVSGKPKKTLVLLSSVRHPDEGGGGGVVGGTDLANGFNDIVDSSCGKSNNFWGGLLK